MNKIKNVLIILICVITLGVFGCSYADNATLVRIADKYNYITNNYQDNLFLGKRLLPSYTSNNLITVIYSNNENYNVLKTNAYLGNYSLRGEYGILMEGVNFTYLNSNAQAIVSNNEITEKKYKKGMYLSLESLEKNVKKLNSDKISLESVFDNTEDLSQDNINKEGGLLRHNLDKYKNSLNACLVNLYDFNKNYYFALNNNIVKPTNLEDLLYGVNVSNDISQEYVVMLINNASLMVSSYALNYSINLKNDVIDSRDLLNLLAQLMDGKVVLDNKSGDFKNALDAYKMIRTIENGIIERETSFNNSVKALKKSSFKNPNTVEQNAIENISNYQKELSSYVAKLIAFIQSL